MGALFQPDRLCVILGIGALLAALAGCGWQLDREWRAARSRRALRRDIAYILAGLTPRARQVRQIEVLTRHRAGEDCDLPHERHPSS